MKKFKITLFCAFLSIFGANLANAQSILDLFGGDTGSTVTNILEGVFSSSNLTVSDLSGDWTATGPAVCFESENMLKKAGGIAAASVLETKLSPYYKQYGLTGANMVIQKDGSFTLTVKGVTLRGVLSQPANAAKGEFLATFTALGTIKLGSFKTYVQKTSSSMDVMFDATKLKTLLAGITKLSGNSLAKGVTSLLDSYDGLCVGFKFSLNGRVSTTGTTSGRATSTGTTTGKTTTTNTNSNTNSNTKSTNLIEEGLNFLTGGNKSNSSTKSETEQSTKKGRAY